MGRVYITGASGVIGSDLAQHFAWENYREFRAVSRRPCPTLPANHPAQVQVETIFDGAWLAPDDRDATILHCAGLSNPREDFRNFAVLAREHVLPPVEMIEALLARGWRGRMVLFSSGGTVYGNPLELPIPEDHPLAPISAYGLHKVILERAFSDLALQRDFELVILRVSNPYGSMVTKPNQGVIPILIRAFLRGEAFNMIGDGTAERDYISMRDLNDAVDRVIDFEMPSPVEIFNIGSGEKTSLNDLISILHDLTGRDLQLRHTASKVDVHSNVLDCSHARDELGWSAKVALHDGLKDYLEHFNVHHERA